MGYDVYGLQPKNLEYRNTNHPGELDFSKFDFNSPEYKEHNKKEWDANATSGYYFRQSVGGYWGIIMSFASQIIKDLPKEVMFNDGIVIEEDDALKIGFYINETLKKDGFEDAAKKFLADEDGNVSEETYNEFVNILSTFVQFAKNSGGFRIS